MIKKAFTVIELFIVISIIAVLFTFSTYTYSGIQEKSRTSKNLSYANEIIQAVDRFKILDLDARRYPTKNNESSDFIAKDKQSFNELLSNYVLEHISFDLPPDSKNSTRLFFISCKNSAGIPNGVIIEYWDYGKKQTKKVSNGNTDGECK